MSSGILAGSISRSDGNFWNAYEIYEWVRYMYTHNETVFEGTDNANETINKLEAYALALAQAKLTTPSTATGVSEESVIVTTVAGRTLARKMIDQLKSNIHWRGSNDKLSVLFGSYEPLLSFLSVTGVLTRENLRSGPFSRLPDHGAALVVELISGDNDEKTSDELPSEENLSVRLYYRENTDEDTPFERYSMLGSGLGGQSIPYTSFARAASDDGLSSEEWCTICDAQQAPFCPTAMNLNEICKTADGDNNDASGMYGPDSGRMNPAVAGVIGATVFGAIGGLAAAALYLLAGVRLRRLGPEERSSMIGGFKGPEKRHGDADVEVTSGGAQQERVGSWELRGSDSGAQDGPGAGVSTKEPSRARMREVNQWREDDEISLVGATPVAVREGL